jgi:Spx/MgsR family transcriptional regulator
MITLYGIPTCDTCRKARKSLEANGLEVRFRDVRSGPLSRTDIARIFAVFGPDFLNRRSTTWRALSDDVRTGDPIDLLVAHPTLMKRPVIESEPALTLGWDASAQTAHLGGSAAGV